MTKITDFVSSINCLSPNDSLLRLLGTLDPNADLGVMLYLNENLYCTSEVLMLKFLNHGDDGLAVAQLVQGATTDLGKEERLSFLGSCLPI
jgi:hypothetical protein